jgi:hypothetical protein
VGAALRDTGTRQVSWRAAAARFPWIALGALGPVLRIRNLGAPTPAGAAVLAVACLVWAVALEFADHRSARRWTAPVAVAVLAVATTRPTVGRDALLVAFLGVVVADASVRRRAPTLPWRRHGCGVSVPGLLLLGWAQLEWTRQATLGEVLLILVLALAVAPLLVLRPPRAAELRRARSSLAVVARRSAAASTLALRRLGGAIEALWRDPRAHVGAAAIAAGALWGPAFWRLVNSDPQVRALGINDYPLHLEVARFFEVIPFSTQAPHFLFHLATSLWSDVVGPQLAPVLVLSAATSLSCVAVVAMMRHGGVNGRRLGPLAGLSAGVGYFFLESPTLLALAVGLVSPSTPFQTVHWWGNPTWIAALPFVLFTFVLIERLLDGGPQGRRDTTALVAAVVAATIAKPSLTLVLIPGVPLYLLWRRPTRPVARILVLAVAAPAAVVVIWQTWFLGLSAQSAFSSGWVIDPIVPPPFGWSSIGLWFPLPSFVVLLAALLHRRRFFGRQSVQLGLICLAVALPLMLAVRETDERAVHGNFAVPTQACIAVLFLLALRELFLGLSDRRGIGPWNWTRVVSAAVIAAFLAGGVLSYLDGLGLVHVPIGWLDAI